MLDSLGRQEFIESRFAQALPLLTESHGIMVALDDRVGLARVLSHLGFLEHLQHRPAAARAIFERGLSVALAAGIYFWPYDARCGFELFGYLAAVGVVTASGLWSAVWTWRHRSARGHTLSLLLILWGTVLGAIEVLPRIGYAKTDALHPATWTCK